MNVRKEENALVYERTVAFGDCDPAGILYTPRALDYCLEAIDEFWKSILEGRGWYEMNVDLDRGTPFVNVNINFRSPITARFPLQVSTELTKVGSSSVTFEVATFQEGRLCFQASLTSVLVVKSQMKKVESDDWLRRALTNSFSPPPAP